MKLAVFVSDLRRTEETLERIKAEKLGVVLVENGIYHAVVKEGGKESPVLSTAGATFYALTDDLETRGYTTANLNAKVKPVSYADIVDLIMNEYEKTAWL